MRKSVKRIMGLFALAAVLAAGYGRLYTSLPSQVTLAPGEQLNLSQTPWVTVRQMSGRLPAAVMTEGSSYSVELALWGVIPIKTVQANVAQRRTVVASGTAFGLKMFSAGVMAVSFTDICTDSGYQNPAKEAGLKLGDYLNTIDGTPLRTNEQVRQIVEASGGESLTLCYSRDGKNYTTTLQPVKDALTGSWRVGVWVRDSSAGIGTLTFYDPQTGVFGGLGHSVTDVDTGESLTLSTGEIVPVEISGAIAGQAGLPGELRGSFVPNAAALGTIRANGETGLYGLLYDDKEPTGVELPVAYLQEIVTGEAEIITTVDDSGPHRYKIQIEQLSYNAEDPNKNMLLRVTDDQLLAKTGGIVQGMSGSPIIQNGRLVGAVTHVLVKDPTLGYGIFIENMLDAAS